MLLLLLFLRISTSESLGVNADYYIAELLGFTSFSVNTTSRFAYFPNLPPGELYVVRIVAVSLHYGYGSYSNGFSQRINRKIQYTGFI